MSEKERRSRAAEFELRARGMGISDENLVAQKIAIWEGMWVAKQHGDNVGVSIVFFILFLSEVVVRLLLVGMGG